MALNVTSALNNGIAKITLAGELDANSAPLFRSEIEKVAAEHPRRLVLLLEALDYMASAGLRVLIYARQQMAREVDIFVVGAQEGVRDTLEKTGFHHSVTQLDSYDAAVIESI